MKTELVKNWMTENIITISTETTVPEALRTMREQGVRRLPVVNENGRLIGVVTLGDIRGAQPSTATLLNMWELGYLLGNLKVKEIMAPSPITINKAATIGTAAQIMLENHVGGLPVVDEGDEMIGIITESDIFNMVVLHEWGIVGSEEDEEMIATA